MMRSATSAAAASAAARSSAPAKEPSGMDGSGLSLIVVPIVAVICLAALLIMVFYAESHPQWDRAPAHRRLDEARAADPAGTQRDSTPATMRAREPVAAPKARPTAASFQDEAHD